MYWELHTVLAYLGKTKNKNRRFPPHNSLYNCFRILPTKNRPDARTKTAQKRRKKCFTHTLHTDPKYTGFFADFWAAHNFEKSLDFCGQLIYYSVRYSGIVQSVEQRTVNYAFYFTIKRSTLRRNSPQRSTHTAQKIHQIPSQIDTNMPLI